MPNPRRKPVSSTLSGILAYPPASSRPRPGGFSSAAPRPERSRTSKTARHSTTSSPSAVTEVGRGRRATSSSQRSWNAMPMFLKNVASSRRGSFPRREPLSRPRARGVNSLSRARGGEGRAPQDGLLRRRQPLEALAPERELRSGAVPVELGAPGEPHQTRERAVALPRRPRARRRRLLLQAAPLVLLAATAGTRVVPPDGAHAQRPSPAPSGWMR